MTIMLTSFRRLSSFMSTTAARLPAVLFILTITALCGIRAVAQTPEPPATQTEEPATAKTHPNNPEMWNVDAMVEDAILQIARRYNLNKAQEEYTRLLLTQRVKAFLKIYEDDVRTLLKESIDFRTGLKPVTREAIMDWAERALPVYQAARDAILEGNDEWRQILTEEQIKTHDMDLQQMETQFTSVSNLLGETREGGGLLNVMMGARAGDPGKSAGLVSTNPVSKVTQHTEDNWQAYVEQFIRVYKLDEKQQNSVRAGIYNETFEQAKQHREKSKGQFEKLEAELKIVENNPKLANRRADLLTQRMRLELPIRTGFSEMARRMDSQLTEKQRSAADSEGIKALERMREELSGQREITRVPGTGATPPSTQPATSTATASQPDPDQEPPPAPAPASQPAKKPVERPAAKDRPERPPPAEVKPADKPKIPDPLPSESNKPDPARQDERTSPG